VECRLKVEDAHLWKLAVPASRSSASQDEDNTNRGSEEEEEEEEMVVKAKEVEKVEMVEIKEEVVEDAAKH
jgi:hypothetical protein